MCGIAGIINSKAMESPRRAVIERMLGTLRHRGPDDRAVHIDGNVALGHARLSIIDLESGRQPLFNEDDSVAVVCNGEIYNYRELRKELIAAGHRFRTNSDCEVLVHLWEEHGPDMLAKLRGMFAFVLYDRNTKTLFGARDHFGQKPLFYAQSAEQFAFASEIKALLTLPGASRELDAGALDRFLFYKYVPAPATLFQSVRQLPAGHCFELKDGRFQVSRYWQPSYETETTLRDDEHLDRIESALEAGIARHLVSDVPVAVFLSGGLDSSLITAMAARSYNRRLQTFSISFPDAKDDESRFAELASREFDTEHHAVPFRPETVRETLETIGRIYDQPLADSAALPLLHLSRLAGEHVKVVLTGDGGDEIFGGYRKYRRAVSPIAKAGLMLGGRLFSTRRTAACAGDPLRLRKAWSRLGLVVAPTWRTNYQRKHWEGWQRHELYQPEFAAALPKQFEDPRDFGNPRDLAKAHPLHVMLLADQTAALPNDLLHKTDYATMTHSLEARAPFLDVDLFAAAAQLPPHLLVSTKQTKVALRQIAKSWLPKTLVERPKKGFSFSLGDWFRGDLKPWVRGCLLRNSETTPKYFRPEIVDRFLTEHETGQRDHRGRIFSLLCFELWHRNFAAARPAQSELPRAA